MSQNRCRICQKEDALKKYKAERIERERLADIRARANALQVEQQKALIQSRLTTIDNLISLSPQAFEDAVAVMYERLGYEVKQKPRKPARFLIFKW